MNYLDFDKSDQKIRGRKIIFKVILWIAELAIVIGLAYFIVQFAIEKTTMLGSSMNDTLLTEDKIIINKLSYLFKDPNRFDIIVFKQSGKEHSYYNIKRVIGLPGETVQIKDGSVYINDELLTEPVNVELIHVPGLAEDAIVLEEDEYFVLGDARNNSEDSRFANIGTVVKNEIIGKAWLRSAPDFAFISKLNLVPVKKEEEAK